VTANQPRRHVWVDCIGGTRQAGLIVAWRRTTTGSWEAQVAIATLNSMLLTWTPAADLYPIADDRWHSIPGLGSADG